VRPPVLVAGDFTGLAIPDARSTRVEVDRRGALTLVRRGGPAEVLAEAGVIDRITPIDGSHLPSGRFVPPAHLGLVVFWSGDRRMVAVAWNQVWAASFNLPTVQELRHACGVEAVAQALGAAVEAPTEADVRQARTWGRDDVLTLIDPAVLPPRWAAPGMALLVVLAFAGLPATGAWWVVVPTLALLTGPSLSTRRRRREFRRLVTTPLDPAGRSSVRPSPSGSTSRMVTIHELQIGADDVVLRTEASEWWQLGPRRGGVRTLDVHPEHWILRDVGHRQVLTLSAVAWGDVLPELERACSQAGIDVRHHAEPFLGPVARIDGPRPATARAHPGDDDVENGNGGTTVSTLRQVALFLALLASLLSVTRYEWWAIPIVLWAFALALVSLEAVALHARWVRDLRRPITIHEKETT
jgi:hypothetical protein